MLVNRPVSHGNRPCQCRFYVIYNVGAGTPVPGHALCRTPEMTDQELAGDPRCLLSRYPRRSAMRRMADLAPCAASRAQRGIASDDVPPWSHRDETPEEARQVALIGEAFRARPEQSEPPPTAAPSRDRRGTGSSIVESAGPSNGGTRARGGTDPGPRGAHPSRVKSSA